MSPKVVYISGLILFSIGCGPKAVSSSAVNSPFASTPQLPNPQAGSYARVIESPSDPAVAAVIGDRRWDASLSGTAAGLALRSIENEGGFSTREIREAAWRAGYPYPIAHLAVWQASPKSPPPADVRTWLTELSQEMDVGLVRARSGIREVWVGLAAHPLIDLGVIPRETAVQTPLKLPAIAGASLQVSDPLGQWYEYRMTDSLTVDLNAKGEWLFAITDPKGDLARFTVYAGTEAPAEPVILGSAVPVANGEAAKRAAMDILADTREIYGVLPWSEDPYLVSTASTLFDSKSAEPLDEKMSTWQCSGRTVEDCVDQMLWIPEYRATLLNPESKYVGISAHMSASGIELKVLIANE